MANIQGEFANISNSTNSFYNIITATVLGIIITNSTHVIPKIVMMIINLFFSYLEKIYNKLFGQHNEVILTSMLQKTCHGLIETCPVEYDAVVHKINSKNINTIRVMNKHTTPEPSRYNDNKNEMTMAKYKICHDEIIKLSSKYDLNMKCTIKEEDNTFSNQKSNHITSYNLHIRSKKLTVPEIIKKMDKWRIKYINHKKSYVNDGNTYYYFQTRHNYVKKDTSDDNFGFMGDPRRVHNNNKPDQSIFLWNKHRLITTKSFDNIFFEDKEQLLYRLNYFLKNNNEYLRKGIPYNLGLLFYGDPGCGKTSCIKALSDYTKRHVVEINLKNIKTCGEFIDIFRNEFINDEFLPIDKRIIVLEDIDCMLDIVQQRKLKPDLFLLNSEESLKDNTLSSTFHNDELVVSNDNDLSRPEKNSVPKIKEIDSLESILKVAMIDSYKKQINTEEKLTLSCILNTIDGVLEQNGRILIITTNYKDKLDKALLRPGRIDMKVHFRKCSNEMTKNIIEHFYDESVPNDVTFKDNVYTPAEIIEKCFNNPNDVQKLIKNFID